MLHRLQSRVRNVVAMCSMVLMALVLAQTAVTTLDRAQHAYGVEHAPVALAGQVQDVVICGHDRGEVGLLVFPTPGTATPDNTTRGAVTDDRLKARIEAGLRAMNAGVTGSAKRITRALILAEAPSVEGQEVTDKGSLNINKILKRRAELLERLYDNEDPALIRV